MIEYDDTGGEGPVVVLCHGLPMNGEQWRLVVPLLAGYRVIRPTLPLGAHRYPMEPDADLSQRGVALMLADFIDALDLHDVTLVLNDWGGGVFVISEGRDQRIGRLAMVACEAFDNFPPGVAKLMGKLVGLPGMARLFFWAHQFGPVRRMPGAYGSMSLRGVPDEVMARWFEPGHVDPGVRRDFVEFATSTPDRGTLLAWSHRLASFDRPVLVVWAGQDVMMPAEHGPRLVSLFPDARLVVVDDSATLIPEDQPERLAQELRDFLAATGAPPSG